MFGEKEEKSCEVNKINHPFIFVFLGLHLQHMEVSRLEFELELQPQVYTIATAMRDLSSVCDLHHSSQQCQILNHRAGPGIEPKTSWILVRFLTYRVTEKTPLWLILISLLLL